MGSWIAVVLSLLACGVLGASRSSVTLTVARLNDKAPVISHGIPANNSIFPYSYNPSWVEPTSGSGDTSCLLVRCQMAPGKQSVIGITCPASPESLTVFPPITSKSVVFFPSTPEEKLGTEDPRIAYVPSLRKYFLFYTAVSNSSNGDWIARLSVASTADPRSSVGWTRHGALFPDVNHYQFSKSGALLINDKGPSYLIFGDCSVFNGLQVAEASADFTKYTVLPQFLLIRVREGMFDSYLVESGPPPLRLLNGDWFFIYNAAQRLAGPPNGLLYAPGWVILNGSNPLQVLHRSDKPLMMPTMEWETDGLTPYVIFIEAMRYDPTSQQPNRFVVYYGAADTSVGAAIVIVETKEEEVHSITVARAAMP